jgi:hypothetical protein
MPGPPPEHPHLRLLKGNPGKRRVRVPPEPARKEQCPEPPEHLGFHSAHYERVDRRCAAVVTGLAGQVSAARSSN